MCLNYWNVHPNFFCIKTSVKMSKKIITVRNSQMQWNIWLEISLLVVLWAPPPHILVDMLSLFQSGWVQIIPSTVLDLPTALLRERKVDLLVCTLTTGWLMWYLLLIWNYLFSISAKIFRALATSSRIWKKMMIMLSFFPELFRFFRNFIFLELSKGKITVNGFIFRDLKSLQELCLLRKGPAK